MRKPSQRERILAELQTRAALNRGICSTEMLAAYIPRAAAVVHGLRDEGYDIITEDCQVHAFQNHTRHENKQIQYRLVPQTKQLELI
jgi:hypothetical protein